MAKKRFTKMAKKAANMNERQITLLLKTLRTQCEAKIFELEGKECKELEKNGCSLFSVDLLTLL